MKFILNVCLYAIIVLVFSPHAMTHAAKETHIKGGRMELLEKGNKILFKDGVVMTRNSDRLTAKEMETTQKRDKVRARGNVSLYRKVSESENWLGFGETGFYDTKKGEGNLVGGKKKAHLVYKDVISSTATRKMDVFAHRFEFNEKGTGAWARGSVYGKTTDPETGAVYEFWSETAHYIGEEKKVILSGKTQPRVHRTTNEGHESILGDVITYYLDTKKVISDGEAQAVFVETGKPATGDK